MKWPDTVSDLLKEDIVLSWHAGWQLGQRGQIGHFEGIDRVAFGVMSKGVIVGGQIGNQLLIKTECNHNGRDPIELAFVLSKRRGYWLVKTVLTWDMAVANKESMLGYSGEV